MGVRRGIPIICLILALACEVDKGVGPWPLTSTSTLLAPLREQGATATIGGTLRDALPCISTTGQVLVVNGSLGEHLRIRKRRSR